jgi:hypothetical protein
MNWCVFLLASSLLVLFWSVIPASAQSSGVILGVVKDIPGGTVPGATVTVTNVDTNEVRTATTLDDGAFRVPALRTGHYSVRVEKDGFKTVTQSSLNLDVAQELVLNPTLDIGTSVEQVTVSGEAPIVNTTTSSLGGLVNDQQIADLPLNGRNYIDLTLIQPGVQQNIKPSGGGTGSSGTWFSSNGAPARSNSFTLDGALMVNQFGTGANSEAGTTLGVDGIKEYKVITNMFSADYGMTMGSQMVIVSKGGSNLWHGDAFEYLRNNHLDARNFFEAPVSLLDGQRTPQFQRNNFGASVGGPIRKDKTFFYLVYEGLREAQGDTIQDVTLPAACHFVNNNGTPMIIGGGPIPSTVTLPSGFTAANQQTVQNPLTGSTTLASNGCTSATGGSGTNVASVVTPWVGQFPFANEPGISGGNGYTFQGKTTVRDDYGQLRVDHTFSTSDTLFARYTLDDAHLTDPYAQLNPGDTGSAFPQFTVFGGSRNQWFSMGETHIINANLLNSAKIHYSRTFFAAYNSPNTTFLNPFGPLIGPQWSFITGKYEGGYSPGGGTTGLGPATTYTTYHYQNIGTLQDDVFYTAGKHSFKIGALLNRFEEPSVMAKGDTGTVSFANVAGFMSGIPQSYLAVQPNPNFVQPGTTLLLPPYQGNYLDRDYMFNTFGFYIQDDWRATSRLTMNLGARYEFMTSLRELYGRSSTLPDIETSSSTRIGPIMDNPTYKNFSPRVGLAWDIFGTGKTSIRSGFGIYYDVGNIGGLLTQSPSGVPPFSNQTQYVNATNAVIQIPLTFPASQFGKALQISDYNMKEPHSLQYNLTVEQQLPLGIGMSLSYVGTRGLDLLTVMEGNPVTPASYSNGLPIYNVTNGMAGCQNNALTIGGANIFPANAAPCRNNPYWTTMILITSPSSSWYNALQLVMTKRISHGLSMQAAFVYSKDLDTTTGQMFGTECGNNGASIGVNPSDISLDKGPACFDVPVSLHLNILYHFPNLASTGLLSKFTNGWWVGNIVAVQDGVPFTPTISTQRSFDGVGTTGDHASIVTATTAGTGKAAGLTFVPFNSSTVNTGNPNQWFNPLMFQLNPLGTTGTAGRDILRGPGLGNWDFSLVKDTHVGFLGEQGSLQFRAEFFNILNRANFGLPNGVVFAGTASDAGANSEAPTDFRII